MRLWLLKRWPRCKPYDTRIRFCWSHPVWNGRCRKHVNRALKLGEDI